MINSSRIREFELLNNEIINDKFDPRGIYRSCAEIFGVARTSRREASLILLFLFRSNTFRGRALISRAKGNFRGGSSPRSVVARSQRLAEVVEHTAEVP